MLANGVAIPQQHAAKLFFCGCQKLLQLLVVRGVVTFHSAMNFSCIHFLALIAIKCVAQKIRGGTKCGDNSSIRVQWLALRIAVEINYPAGVVRINHRDAHRGYKIVELMHKPIRVIGCCHQPGIIL